MPPFTMPLDVESSSDNGADDQERNERRRLAAAVIGHRGVKRRQRAQELRRQAALSDLELELERVPRRRQMPDDRQRDVIPGEVGRRVAADAAALRVRDGGPGREEDHGADDREEHPQHGLDAVLGRGLDLRDEQLAVDPDHAVASASGRSDAKTLSMTSSIGGSSTLMSASWSPS